MVRHRLAVASRGLALVGAASVLGVVPVTAGAAGYSVTEYFADQGPSQRVVTSPPGLRVAAGVHELDIVATVSRTAGVIQGLAVSDGELGSLGVHGTTSPTCDFSLLGGSRNGGSFWSGSFLGSATVRCHELVEIPGDGKPIPFGGFVQQGWIYAPLAGAGGLAQLYESYPTAVDPVGVSGYPIGATAGSPAYVAPAGAPLALRFANTGSVPLTDPTVSIGDPGGPVIATPSCDFSALGGPPSAASWPGGSIPVDATVYCTTTLPTPNGTDVVSVVGQLATGSPTGAVVVRSNVFHARSGATIPPARITTTVRTQTRRSAGRLASSIVVSLHNTSTNPSRSLTICVYTPRRSIVKRLSRGGYWKRAWCWRTPSVAAARSVSRRIVIGQIQPRPAPSVHIAVTSHGSWLAALSPALRLGTTTSSQEGREQ